MNDASTHRLALEPLGKTTWRLCDRTVPVCDAENVLAFVEQIAPEDYEVTWVAIGIGMQHVPSLEHVLREAAAWLRVEVRAPAHRSSKPFPIPHRPPTASE